MLALRLETGGPADPREATTYSLLSHLWPPGTTHKMGAHAGAPAGKPRNDVTEGVELEPRSYATPFLKLVSLPRKVCVLGGVHGAPL